jgi:[amino group carrier protein]-lysine/ornithine hydrolase
LSDLLKNLVERYSPSRQEASAVSYLVKWMAAHGFTASADVVGNAVGKRGAPDAPNVLMLLGHIDTYPGEIPIRVENGCLYGRGSVDAKGSLCTFADAAAQAVIPDSWQVVVIGAVEEEVATSKGAYYVRDQFRPAMCIIGEPSAANRITLGYKGRLLVDYELFRPVAHTSRPEPSVGASGTVFWQKILTWAEQENAGVERAFDQVLPRLNAICTNTDHFQDTLHMTVGFRLPPRWKPQDVFAVVQGMAEADGNLNAYSVEQAYAGDRNNALVRGMLAAMRTQGSQPGFVLKGGTSDMNVVGAAWDCPIIAYGPGDSNLDHTPDEHIPLDEYALAVRTLRAFIEGLK